MLSQEMISCMKKMVDETVSQKLAELQTKIDDLNKELEKSKAKFHDYLQNIQSIDFTDSGFQTSVQRAIYQLQDTFLKKMVKEIIHDIQNSRESTRLESSPRMELTVLDEKKEKEEKAQDLDKKISAGSFPSALDNLRSLESKLEADVFQSKFVVPSKSLENLKSLDSKIESDLTADVAAGSKLAAPSKSLENLKSLDSKIEADLTAEVAAGSKLAAPSKSLEELKSLEAQIECDFSGAGSSSKDREGQKSLLGQLDDYLQKRGLFSIDPQDLKSLDGMIEADTRPKEHQKQEHKREHKKEKRHKIEHRPGEEATSPKEPAKTTASKKVTSPAPPATTINVPSEKTSSAPWEMTPYPTPARPAVTPSAAAAAQETPGKQLQDEKQEKQKSRSNFFRFKGSPKTQKH